MSTLNYSEAQWRQDIDNARKDAFYSEITEEQAEFIEYAKSGNKPLSWKQIAELWSKQEGWDEMNVYALKSRWQRYKAKEKMTA